MILWTLQSFRDFSINQNEHINWTLLRIPDKKKDQKIGCDVREESQQFMSIQFWLKLMENNIISTLSLQLVLQQGILYYWVWWNNGENIETNVSFSFELFSNETVSIRVISRFHVRFTPFTLPRIVQLNTTTLSNAQRLQNFLTMNDNHECESKCN